jgi:hypothetical protein
MTLAKGLFILFAKRKTLAGKYPAAYDDEDE